MVVLNTDIQTEERFELPDVLSDGMTDTGSDASSFEKAVSETAIRICEEVLRQEWFEDDAEISLVIADAEEVRKLNLEYRGIDSTTDVLSFPALEFEVPADFDGAIDDSCVNPDNGCVMLGDIVINAQKVREQAQEYGHSELREFSFLVAHSMLRLCGYDHMTPEEAEEMEDRQEKVLQTLGITREM